jgi:hypothetical protein
MGRKYISMHALFVIISVAFLVEDPVAESIHWLQLVNPVQAGFILSPIL